MAKSTKPFWVFFDIGGVLMRFNPDYFLEKTARILGIKIHELLKFIEHEGKPPVWTLIELGKSEEEIRQLFCRRFNVDIAPKEFFEAFSSGVEIMDWRRIDPLLKKLRAAKAARLIAGLGIVSNVNTIHAKFAEQTFPRLLNPTDFPPRHRIFSCVVGVRKDRTRAMFDLVFNKYGIRDPGKIIFIDDSPENLVGFRKAGGGIGIQFKGFYDLEDKLIRCGAIRAD